jgi:hypothetical protein
MTIRSNPPGAKVYVDDYEIGATPISRNFTYYGTRKIRLVKDGYETLTVMQPIPPPWYQIPPLDFISENLVPSEHHDRRTLSYQLTPQRVVPSEQLLARGEDLRRQAQSSGIVRSTPSVPGQFVPAGPPPGPATGPYLTPGPQPSGGVPIHTLPPGGWSPPGAP